MVIRELICLRQRLLNQICETYERERQLGLHTTRRQDDESGTVGSVDAGSPDRCLSNPGLAANRYGNWPVR